MIQERIKDGLLKVKITYNDLNVCSIEGSYRVWRLTILTVKHLHFIKGSKPFEINFHPNFT